MKKYILAIDAGTTSSRAIIFDKNGQEIAIAQHEFEQHFPKEGWVEHDPLEIWSSQKKAIEDVLSKNNIQASEIDSIGITNQRETTVIWNKKTGIPIYNAIVWQDRRTANICSDLDQKGYAQTIQNKTGLVLDAYFSGTKIQWILNQNIETRKKAEAGELLFGTIDTWLIWKLSNGKYHVTDPSNASRTMLYNIHTLEWDNELLELINVPKKILPNVISSSQKIGVVQLESWDDEIMISGIAGDQQAALFGQLCFGPGEVKNTYGTGCFCVMNTGNSPVQSKNKMLTTIAWQLDGETTYALEGSVFIGGALIQWLRDGLNLISSAEEIEELAKSVESNGGVTFISALTGLGAPYWDPNAFGAIMGITRGTQKGHLARAALEAIAMRSREIIIEMQKDAGIQYQDLKVDGGACKNNLLMQIQADLLNTTVIRPKTTETTALGVAFLAGLASGFWKNRKELESLWEKEREFVPNKNIQSQNTISLWQERISKIITNES
ncbi:MAG: glycerol kinase GlpK [Flavobacteriales bacterium]|jgi:glycerol kinase|nr:glycerol kinase GlpK [Flavobacteriales bacterium]